jgi:hypothetical protein
VVVVTVVVVSVGVVSVVKVLVPVEAELVAEVVTEETGFEVDVVVVEGSKEETVPLVEKEPPVVPEVVEVVEVVEVRSQANNKPAKKVKKRPIKVRFIRCLAVIVYLCKRCLSQFIIL